MLVPKVFTGSVTDTLMGVLMLQMLGDRLASALITGPNV